MARRKKIVSKPSRKTQRISYGEKLRKLSEFYHVDPTNKRQVNDRWRALQHVPTYLQRPVKDKALRSELKRRGFFTTEKGVIVDSPRDTRRDQIPGARFRINKDATVVWSVKDRRDYVFGFTRADKKAFARDPKGFAAAKLAELQKRYPELKNKPQVRLQWGAYQAQKDFAPQAFERLSTWEQFRAMYGVGRRRRASDVDRLTGLHIVVYKRRAKKNKAKKR